MNEPTIKKKVKQEDEITDHSVASKKSIMKDGVLLIDDPKLRKIIEESRRNYEQRLRKIKQGDKKDDKKKKGKNGAEDDDDDDEQTTTTTDAQLLFTITTTAQQPLYGPVMSIRDFGDLNLDERIDIFDEVALKKMLINGMEFSSYDNFRMIHNADINQDDNVNIADLTLLRKFLLGKIDSFDIDRSKMMMLGKTVETIAADEKEKPFDSLLRDDAFALLRRRKPHRFQRPRGRVEYTC